MENKKQRLHISLYSFGFHKSGIPADPYGHGGGFVFDCRFLYNPGRELRFQDKTGLDAKVIQRLEESPQMSLFLKSSCNLIVAAAENYIDRGFEHLMVSFGCTGGQHRSVFCAERIAACLRKHGYYVTVHHRELDAFLQK